MTDKIRELKQKNGEVQKILDTARELKREHGEDLRYEINEALKTLEENRQKIRVLQH